MSSSLFASVAAFKKLVLTYSVEDVDSTGQPVTTTGDLVVMIAPTGSASWLQLLPGADANVIPVKGELVTPAEFPTGVIVGTALTGTYAGEPVTCKLTSITPNDLVGVPFGDGFTAQMRAGA